VWYFEEVQPLNLMQIEFSDIKYGLCNITLIPETDEEQEQLRKLVEERCRSLNSEVSFTSDGSLVSFKCISLTAVMNSGFENLLAQASSIKPARASTLISTRP
jgi:hypothetical protein